MKLIDILVPIFCQLSRLLSARLYVLSATVAEVAVLYLLISASLSYAFPIEALKTSKPAAADAAGNVPGPLGCAW